MSEVSRLLLRARQQALRWYEMLLYALLLALGSGVALALPPAADEALQCGNIQSSPVVITR